MTQGVPEDRAESASQRVIEICPACLDWPVVKAGGVCRDCARLDGGDALKAMMREIGEQATTLLPSGLHVIFDDRPLEAR